MAFPSPSSSSLQLNPITPFRPSILLYRTQFQVSFKLLFPPPHALSLPSTSEASTNTNDNPPNTKKKKKRKLRPSFLEQTMERWSVKNPSQRDSLPWDSNNSESNKPWDNNNSESKKLSSEVIRDTHLPNLVIGERGVNSRFDSIVGKTNIDFESANSDLLNDDVNSSQEDSNFPVKISRAKFHPLISPTRPKSGKSSSTHFRSTVKNFFSKQNFQLDENDDEVIVEDFYHFIEEEISKTPDSKGAKLKSFDPSPDKPQLDFYREDRKPLEKPQVKLNTDKTNTVTNSFSSQSNKETLSKPNYQNTKSSSPSPSLSPSQTHTLTKNNYERNPNKLKTSKDQKTNLSNPKTKTLDTSISKVMMGSVTLPWESTKEEFNALPVKSNTPLAERTIPEPELKRLRDSALRMIERLKVGPAGITQTLVEAIHEKWKQEEVVKLRFEGPPSLDMKRIHQILEGKTGGIVIWRSGKSVVLFRSMNYQFSCVKSYFKTEPTTKENESSLSSNNNNNKWSNSSDEFGFIESLLDGLGPRFKDWSGRDPLPVDADLLPGSIPGYMPPYRGLPYKTRLTLRDNEMTMLRRLARSMPPHFALGRNREHQGLAAAIVKLWEKSSIAKIAIKRGVLNTRNEQMAHEIKKLTGGTLVSRNKEYIVFYRGNDFLSPFVRDKLVEKEHKVVDKLVEEESARLKALDSISPNKNKNNKKELRKARYVAGTLAETKEAKLKWRNQLSEEEREEIRRDLALSKHASLVRFLERKLFFANVKIEKAERALAKVQENLTPSDLPTDLETVTDEERSKYRSIGLKMKSFLSLGRRGVFDGTVENMHFNWKNKELVKVIVKRKSFAQVKHIAISLEAESGGVLISVDKTTKGYAIVVFRGKNYMRPHILKPMNLLTKRQALVRSIELQRREALKYHILNVQDKIETLKSQLVEMQNGKEMKNGDRILRENDTLSDDDFEEEGDEAYLKTYTASDDDDDDDDDDDNDEEEDDDDSDDADDNNDNDDLID